METDDIRDKAITTEKLADECVTTDQIGAGEVKSANIGEGEVKSVNIGDGEVKEQDIADGAVTERKIANGAVTLDKLPSDFIETYINPVLDLHDEKYKSDLEDMQNQIDGLSEHGVAVSNQFGDDPHIAVSQKAVTEALNRIWDKIGDLTGEWTGGIRMQVTPVTYFIGDNCLVHIIVSSIESENVIEQVEFYFNGELVDRAEPEQGYYETNLMIHTDTDILCRAKVLGIWYEKTAHITQHDGYWIGAAKHGHYTEIMTEETKPITPGMRAAWDVTFDEGDKLFIIVEESCGDSIIRADMNGFEIPMTKQTVTIEGSEFRVFESENMYAAGTYNIDING